MSVSWLVSGVYASAVSESTSMSGIVSDIIGELSRQGIPGHNVVGSFYDQSGAVWTGAVIVRL